MIWDRELQWLIGGIVGVLALASIVGFALKRWSPAEPPEARRTIDNLNARTRAWWGMVILFTLAVFSGGLGSVILFGLASFLALREFITLTPTRRGDHRALFWAFFIITPLQYVLVYERWYGLFTIFIPVYAFLFVQVCAAMAGEVEQFLERTAKINWGLMVCVYFVSHVPALLMLHIPDYVGENGKLLLWFVLVVQISDVLQYVFGKLFGRLKVAPSVSPNKTWAGLVGGVGAATGIGAALWWVTPFTPGEAAWMALAVTSMGFFGGLTMSAVKRDRGVKDYGHLIPGHGGVMDRIDSLCFAAPIFFHITRYYYT